MRAKDIHVAPITSTAANECVRAIHYSGKVVPNSQLHLGVFLDGQLHGAMQFGPSMLKRKTMGLVAGTKWNDFLELNRMAFGPALPRNSESRAIGIALRLIRKRYPNVEWVLSYADGCQCGDGTIYRASGFLLTGIKENKSIMRLPSGEVACKITYAKGKHILKTGAARPPEGSTYLPGFQLRYIYFLKPEARARLTVPVLPFSKITELGAAMYLGEKRAGSKANVAPAFQAGEGGATPTPALQTPEQTASEKFECKEKN